MVYISSYGQRNSAAVVAASSSFAMFRTSFVVSLPGCGSFSPRCVSNPDICDFLCSQLAFLLQDGTLTDEDWDRILQPRGRERLWAPNNAREECLAKAQCAFQSWYGMTTLPSFTAIRLSLLSATPHVSWWFRLIHDGQGVINRTAPRCLSLSFYTLLFGDLIFVLR